MKFRHNSKKRVIILAKDGFMYNVTINTIHLLSLRVKRYGTLQDLIKVRNT